MAENILQSYSEVNFSTPQRVQISFNNRVYDTALSFNKAKLAIELSEDNSLMSDGCVFLSENKYKITYKSMVFQGDRSALSDSFFPCIIYDYFKSYEGEIAFTGYDKERECYYTEKEINGYFITLEGYENNGSKAYSIEIK